MKLRGRKGNPDSETPDASKAGGNRQKIGRRGRYGIAFVLVIGMLVLGFNYLQSPAEGVVREIEESPQTEAISTNVHSGKTFSIELPGGFSQRKTVKQTAPIIEILGFITKGQTFESKRVTITVKKSPPAYLDEESALLFRQRSGDYDTGIATVAGVRSTVMFKKDNTEITYFVSGNNTYAIIAFTTTSPDDQFKEEVSSIVNSFAWK